MIEDFAHKGLKRFYEHDDGRKLPPDMLDRIKIILADLDTAKDIEAMRRPSYALHKLSGDRKGFWAVTVRANWRIVFRLDDGKASDVDFVDYH